jgi:cellulose/xylan binding protein with CBM9 domain
MTPLTLMSDLALSSMLVLGLIASSRTRATGEKRRQLSAYKTDAAMPLDGDLKKWSGADSVTFEGPPLGGHARRATVYALWNSKNLYLAFDVHSSKLQAQVRDHDGDNLWEDDGVEFLLDPHCDRTKDFLPDDFSYHINILNVVYDDRGTPSGQPDPAWNGKAQHMVKIVDDYSYVVEVAVPWPEIGLEPRQNQTVMGIDFCVNGKDPQTGEYNYFDWCGLKVFHDPSGFGDLILAGRRPR